MQRPKNLAPILPDPVLSLPGPELVLLGGGLVLSGPA